LIGCGVGCLALLIFAVSACVGFGLWLSQPGELLEPQQLLASDTLGYIEWTLREEDPGTASVVERLIELSQAQNRGGLTGLPDWVGEFLIERQNARNERQIRQLLPLAAAWTVRAGETRDSDVHLLTLSIEKLGKRLVLVDWAMGWAARMGGDMDVIVHRGERIYPLNDTDSGAPRALFFRGNDVFFTSDPEMAKRAVDLLADTTAGDQGDASELERVFAALPDRPLRGAVSNGRGELYRIWDLMTDLESGPEDEPWSAIRTVAVSGGLTSEDALELAIEALCKDARWASLNADSLLDTMLSDLEFGGVEVETQARAEGERILIDLRVPDLPGQLEKLF